MVKGPHPLGAQGDPLLAPGPGESLSYLTGDFRIFQQQRGHRWSLDDLMTAWVATRPYIARAAPMKALDLGCGLGSVLMMTGWAIPQAQLVGVEAQAPRIELARRSVRFNGLEPRTTLIHSDFREAALASLGPFELITGTPPYFIEGTAVAASDLTAAACRIETRGGIEAYLEVGAPLLAPQGRMVTVTAAMERTRVAQGAAQVGLHVVETLEITPIEGKAPLICIDVFQQEPLPLQTRALTVRNAGQQWTPQFTQVRDDMGLPTRPP